MMNKTFCYSLYFSLQGEMSDNEKKNDILVKSIVVILVLVKINIVHNYNKKIYLNLKYMKKNIFSF